MSENKRYGKIFGRIQLMGQWGGKTHKKRKGSRSEACGEDCRRMNVSRVKSVACGKERCDVAATPFLALGRASSYQVRLLEAVLRKRENRIFLGFKLTAALIDARKSKSAAL